MNKNLVPTTLYVREGSAFTPKQLKGMARPNMGACEAGAITSKQVKDMEHPAMGVPEDEASRRVSEAALLGVEEPEMSGNTRILPDGPNNDILLDAIDSTPDQEEESKDQAEMASTGSLPGLEGYVSSDEETTTTQAQVDTTGAVSGDYISFAPTVATILKGTRPTPHRVGCIIHAFRMRLGRIGGVTTDDFDKWLADQDWEVDVAIDIFLQITVPAARKADEDNEPGRSLLKQQKDHMLAGAAYSRHGNHRRTISVLYEMIQALFPGDVMTVMRIANLLRETFFDYEEAIMIHEQRRGNAAEMAEVERAERRLCMPGPGGGEPTQVHKDTRVQVFLEAAGTDDWVSARNFLSSAANAWNLGLALDRWMQSGFRTTRPTPTEFRRLRYRAPQLSHLEQDNLWPPPRPIFQMTTADTTDIANSTEDYGTGSYVSENSRYINLDPYRAVVGINRPDLLEQFHINRGKGTVIPMLAAGIPEGDSMVPMSFLNSRHITMLNKTYLQNPSRSGGISKRQAGIRYTHGECDWMYSWHEDRVMAYQAQNPSFVLPADQTWKDVVDFDADELTEDLNSEFQGKVTIGSPAPRPERERSSVDLRRKRIQILCTDFGFDFSPIR